MDIADYLSPTERVQVRLDGAHFAAVRGDGAEVELHARHGARGARPLSTCTRGQRTRAPRPAPRLPGGRHVGYPPSAT